MTWRFLTLLLCAALLVGVAAQHQNWLLEQRRDWGYTDLEGQSPELILATTALGGFRGILVDLVWLRSIKLQQEGKYWELVQLSDWMGKMEPYIEDIWEFNGWNMAYNIVAELQDSEERWLWIEKAINLLRGQGMKYIKRSAVLSYQLAWIYWQKIGGDNDEHHVYYKHRLALNMDRLFGPFHSDVEPLANAAVTEEELFRDPDCDKFRHACWLTGLKRGSLLPAFPAMLANAEKLNDQLKPLFSDEKHAAARRKLEAFYRAPAIRKQLKLNLRTMLDIQKRHGNLDWRLPEPHALYYAEQSLRYAKKKFHVLSGNRLVFYSIKRMYRRGKVSYMSANPRGEFVVGPNYDMVPHLDRMYKIIIASIPREQWEVKGTWKSGHEGLLKDVVRQLYFADLKGLAGQYFNQLVREYPSTQWGKYDMKTWVLGHIKQFVEEYAPKNQMEQSVRSILRRCFFWLAAGDTTQHTRYYNYAKSMWDYFYNDAIMRIDKPGRAKQIAKLPSFALLRDSELRVILSRPGLGFTPTLIERLKVHLGEEKVKELESTETAPKRFLPGQQPTRPAPAVAK